MICGDAAFNTISRFVAENNIQLLAPYVAPRGGKDRFNKRFKYYLEANCYLCPNWKMLTYNNIDKNGYMQYQIERYECDRCPFIKRCLKNYPKKIIRRHLYTEYLEQNRNFRLSEEGKSIYKLRKTSIE